MNTKRKKKMAALDKYVIFSLISLIVFTVVEIIVGAVTGVEQSTLITCFFGVFGGELFCLAMIKRLKLKEGKKNAETYE